MLGAI